MSHPIDKIYPCCARIKSLRKSLLMLHKHQQELNGFMHPDDAAKDDWRMGDKAGKSSLPKRIGIALNGLGCSEWKSRRMWFYHELSPLLKCYINAQHKPRRSSYAQKMELEISPADRSHSNSELNFKISMLGYLGSAEAKTAVGFVTIFSEVSWWDRAASEWKKEKGMEPITKAFRENIAVPGLLLVILNEKMDDLVRAAAEIDLTEIMGKTVFDLTMEMVGKLQTLGR